MKVFSVLVATMLLAWPAQPDGQDSSMTEMEFEGTVSSMSGTTIALFEGRVVVEAANVPGVGNLRAGIHLELEVIVDDSGRLIAHEMEIENDDSESSIEGLITGIDPVRSILTLGPVQVVLNESTRFDGLDPSSLVVGMPVEVEVESYPQKVCK